MHNTVIIILIIVVIIIITQGVLKKRLLKGAISEGLLVQRAKSACSAVILRLYNVLKSWSSVTTYKPLQYFAGKILQKKFTPQTPWITVVHIHIFFLWHNSPTRARAAPFLSFPHHTRWLTTVGRTPLDEGSARNGQHYERLISVPPVGFKLATATIDRPQTVALSNVHVVNVIQ